MFNSASCIRRATNIIAVITFEDIQTVIVRVQGHFLSHAFIFH
jgi:hypothetical protein